MNYEQSNVGLGMVPHKRNCRCDECRIEKQQQRIRMLEIELRELLAYAKDSVAVNGENPAFLKDAEKLLEDK